MNIMRIAGFVIMFLGIGLRIADLPGFTIAFVVGAILIIIPRLHQWLN